MGIESKAELRKRLLAARRATSPTTRRANAEALAAHASTLVNTGAVVCAYVPVGTEPGSIDLLDALVAAGAEVLLPITSTIDGVAQPLSWASYLPGELAPARYGLLEPTGPVLPPPTLARADVIVIPALAVDRRGVRLGRGAGFYDRSLGLRAATATLVAVIFDHELLEKLPSEPHDVAMTHALTPGAGVVTLG